AIHNGPCCDSCVGAYIWGDAVPAAKEARRSLVGYAFYNEQTSESVARGNDLFLVCGPIPEPEDQSEFQEAARRVTSLVQPALEAAGLKPPLDAQTCHVLRLSIDLDTAQPPKLTCTNPVPS